ncbi:hypothetical protein DPMN_128999 [Dreissena polymorpha]|uniref:Uncharacterized protein n=1 Tax=Dreissena polymorpha TaxID=45954 RepID=A0A9D4H3X5_DREPO|nr:hypothetical protein DPMN_128999 [Dreissena polymorpha]
MRNRIWRSAERVPVVVGFHTVVPGYVPRVPATSGTHGACRLLAANIVAPQ